MKTPPFYFNFYNTGTWSTLSIKGDFRSGVQLSTFYSFIQTMANLYKGSLTVDLKEVFYMDSDSMNLINDLEDRCEIIWDKDSFAYKRYKEKYEQT